ncbi:hypothetical protein [Nitrospira sp. Nam74]
MMRVCKTSHPLVSTSSSSRLGIILGIVSMSAGVCNALQDPSVSLAGSASAERAPIQHERLVADGIVERYLMDPRGDVEGILLTDGTQMHVTSRSVADFTKAIKPGDHIRVEGIRKNGNQVVTPNVISNESTGTRFTVPLRLDLPALPLDRLAMTALKVEGLIRVLLYSPLSGEVYGMVLSDGTQVRLPPDVSVEFRRSFKVGTQVTVEGYGTENQHGRALEALSMSANGGPLIPLDLTIRHLP